MSPDHSRIQVQSTGLFPLPLLPLVLDQSPSLFLLLLLLVFNICLCEKALNKDTLHYFLPHPYQIWLSWAILFLFCFPKGNISSEIEHPLPDSPFLVRKFMHEAKRWQILNHHPAQRGALMHWVLGMKYVQIPMLAKTHCDTINTSLTITNVNKTSELLSKK